MQSRSPPHKFPELRKTAKRHIHWAVVKTYTTTYKAGRTRITIKSVNKPKPTRLFRTSRGLRTFKATNTKVSRKEVLIVMATKTRKKGKQVDEELQELEELEELEELDEDEDEEDEEDDEDEDEDDEDDEPEDEDDEDEDDEDEEPAPKRSRSKTKASAKSKKSRKPAQSRAAANGKVGSQEVAEHCGIDGRTLRILLRKHEIEKDPDSGRYEWSSLNHPVVKKIVKLVKSGGAQAAKKEGLDRLKASKGKTSTKKTAAKKTTTKRRRRAVEDDDE
jgi:hypothetical protein